MSDRLEEVKNQPRSVSQLKSYNRCPYAYYLARIERVWQRPAAWQPMGTAVHAAVEAFERSTRTLTLEDAQDVFRDSYVAESDRLLHETPNMGCWSNSGPYDGEADIERRFKIGLDQVARYLEFCAKHPDERPWITPEGGPAIELYVEADLDGVKVRGYVDLVIKGDGKLVVRDVKTGQPPGDDLQLGIYAFGIEDRFGVRPATGDYWMGKSGKATFPYDLSEWDRAKVTDVFTELDNNIRAERFEPKPSPENCRRCDVNASCPFFQG